MSACRLYIMDTESVINEVKLRPALWNVHVDAYKSKVLKYKAWQEVCKAVSSDYVNSPQGEQRQIERAVQLRWKTARDAYIKCRANPPKSTYKGKNKYVFYDALTFLEQTKDAEAETIDKRVNNHQTDPVEEDRTEDTSSVLSSSMPTSRKIMPRKGWVKRKIRGMTDFESQLLRIMKNGMPPSVSTSTLVLQEDDQNFFNSLAPIIKGFDNFKKLAFRSKILDLAMEMENVQAIIKQEPTTYIVQGIMPDSNH